MRLPTASLRHECLALFQAGLCAADARTAVRQCLSFSDDSLHIQLALHQPESVRQGHWRSIHVIAVGKAAFAMASAACETLPDTVLGSRPIVVTNVDNAQDNPAFDTLIAGHPLPDSDGLRASLAVMDRLKYAKAGELVLFLLSGGGSAMLPCPADGIALADKMRITEQLLGSGATINDINCVRKHLSKVKGGGLARIAFPADVHTLILSDVVGDDLSAIASGPTVADDTTFADAIGVLKNGGCWSSAPSSIKQYLEQGASGLRPETVKTADPILANCSQTLVGSNRQSIDAMARQAEQSGFTATVYRYPLCGETRVVAETWAECLPAAAQPTAMITGGETTVTLSRPHGLGGRNQELALAFALAAERSQLTTDWCFLSGGTDGRDGPTDAAGAVVDRGTLQRMRLAGIDPLAALDHHDAYPALRAAGDLLHTGATGTNVADLQILLMRSAPIPN